MIEGLKLDFSSEELHDILTARAEHHTERSQFYHRQVTALRTGGARPAAAHRAGSSARAHPSRPQPPRGAP